MRHFLAISPYVKKGENKQGVTFFTFGNMNHPTNYCVVAFSTYKFVYISWNFNSGTNLVLRYIFKKSSITIRRDHRIVFLTFPVRF